MTWTIRQTLDVHDERGDIVATAATTEAAARIVAMAEALENARQKIDGILRGQHNGWDRELAELRDSLATIDGTEGRR